MECYCLALGWWYRDGARNDTESYLQLFGEKVDAAQTSDHVCHCESSHSKDLTSARAGILLVDQLEYNTFLSVASPIFYVLAS